MSECVFCKIIGGQIPSFKVGENKDMIAILDIKPNTHGHTLILSKEHVKNARDMPPPLWTGMMELAKSIGEKQIQVLGAGGFNLFMNNESVAEQIIMHAHVHVIPRYLNDGLKFAQPAQEYSASVMKSIAAKLNLGQMF